MRIDATDPKDPQWRKYMFPCEASDTGCYLHVEWWEDETHREWPGHLELTPALWSPTIWGRIKAAAKILTGRRHYFNGLILDNDTTGLLIESINEQRERKGKQNGKIQPASKD